MAQLNFFLLGAPRLEREGVAVEFDTRKAIALLAYLALGGESYSRDTLAALLWPEYDQSQARGNLRRTLSVLSKGIGQEWLQVDRETIGLTGDDGLWIDAVQFQRLLADCYSHDHPAEEICTDCLTSLTEALDLYHGEFMAGFNLRDASEEFETWQRYHSESLRHEMARILERLISGYIAQNQFEPAMLHARRWLTLDPLDEVAQRRLMELYARTGQRTAALRQYQDLVRLLNEELGVPPGEESEALYRAIEENRLSTASRTVPTNGQAGSALSAPNGEQWTDTNPAPPHNLPAQMTRFIGRESELAELTHLLTEPSCRLLTLIGPGGVGKTRLAIELAFALREEFADGVYFVPLAPLREAELIVPTVLEALNFSLYGPNTPTVQLLNYLRQKQMLLVLDNMEHLLPHTSEQDQATIDLLADILHNGPAVKILATSRERLNIHGEWVFELTGLPTPPLDDIDRLENYEAAILFVQSARRGFASFDLTAEEKSAVAHICQLMEGMPLAIELAAAWVHLLSCTEIAMEIERSLDFLTTTARDVPVRQRSLRAAFDHSWNLLSQEERRILRQLSIFRGGFQREAAEQVTGATLSLLSSLVDKSLLHRGAMGRYSLHFLIRQYATAHLADDPQEEQETRKRHSNHYLKLLCKREAALYSSHQKDALAELNAEIDNLRVAWNSAITEQQIVIMRCATWPLWYFYELRNYFQEGETVLLRGAEMVQARLAELGSNGCEQERAKFEGALGELQAHQAFFDIRLGRNSEAVALFESSISLLRPLQEPARLAFALAHYGLVRWIIGEFEEAARNLHEGLTLSRSLDHRWQLAIFTAFMGVIAHERDDYDEAYRLLSEAMARCRALGDPRLIAFSSSFLSRTAQKLGRGTEMQQPLQEGLQLATETGDRFSIGLMLERLALVAQDRSDYAEAQRLFDESVKLYREISDPWSLARVLNLLGGFALETKNYFQARTSFTEAYQHAQTGQFYPLALDALAGMAALYAVESAPEAALELALHILQHPACTQDARDRVGQLRSEIEAQLAPSQIETIQARVQSGTLKVLPGEILR